MKRGTSDAETCRLNGWEVGTILDGIEGITLRIQITAIGERRIFAKMLPDGDEAEWALQMRDWKQVGKVHEPTPTADLLAACEESLPFVAIATCEHANQNEGGRQNAQACLDQLQEIVKAEKLSKLGRPQSEDRG